MDNTEQKPNTAAPVPAKPGLDLDAACKKMGIAKVTLHALIDQGRVEVVARDADGKATRVKV